MLWKADALEAEILRHAGELDDLIEHLLPALGLVSDRALATHVPANPILPDLLPAVTFSGAAAMSMLTSFFHIRIFHPSEMR